MQINKVVNQDLTFLVRWLYTNRISLSAIKTEVVLFRRKKKQLHYDRNLKLCGKTF